MAQKRRQPEIIAGRVGSTGTVDVGDGFAVVKGATGNYTINITAAGFRLASVTATAIGSANQVVNVTQLTATSFLAIVFAGSTGTGNDAPWAFTAVGVQQ